MLGNLFGKKHQGVPQSQSVDQVSLQQSVGTEPAQAQTAPAQPQQPGDLSNVGMDPAKRQNVTALSHLDARSNQVLQQAQNEAKRLSIGTIEPDLILLGLLYDREIFSLLQEFSVDVSSLAKELQSKQQQGTFTGKAILSDASLKIFDEAHKNSKNRGSSFVGPEDILLSLFSSQTIADSLGQKGIKKEGVEKALSKKTSYSSGKKSVLSQFGIDLTDMAKQGKLDPVVGRDKEIERLIHILLRRTKNNPVVIGEAGVGKTAIIEALAQKIVDDKVPEQLKGRKIIQLDLASVIAGASHRGEFEERLRNVIKEVQASSGKILLFVDEIHTLIGAGDTDGAMDASNIVKPYLTRGQIQLIGTTTTAEYRKNFEKDKAFQRRFQSIMVDEPDIDKAIEMMNVLKSRYEKFHNVTITDEAIKFSVILSKKYIGERYLPDKSIDLIDEASAEVKLKSAEGKRKDKDVKKADIEKVVSDWTGIPITRLTEDESQKLLKLEELIHKRLIDQEEAVTSVSEAVRRGRIGLSSAKRPIASFIFLGPTGVGKTELAKTVAEILFGKDDAMVRLDMSEYMEKHEVSKLIGAPPGYVGYEEGGQLTEAVRAKPYSIVLFDEVEKAHPDVFNILLQILEDGRLTDNKGNTISFKNTIIIATSNIGSSMIQEKLSQMKKGDKVTKDKLPAPAEKENVNEKSGEVATGQSLQPNDMNKDLQPASGNVKSMDVKKDTDKIPAEEQKVFEELSKKLMDELTKFFRPELLNRFDGIVIFKPLLEKHMVDIAKLGIKNTQKLLKEQGFGFEVSDKAIEVLAKDGFDPVYGARPLRRLIQTAIENPVSIEIISKKYVDGDIILVDYDSAKQDFTFGKGQRKTPVAEKGQKPQEGMPQTNQQQTELKGNGLSQPQNIQSSDQIPPPPPQQPPKPKGMINDPYAPVQNPTIPPPVNPVTGKTMQVGQSPIKPQS